MCRVSCLRTVHSLDIKQPQAEHHEEGALKGTHAGSEYTQKEGYLEECSPNAVVCVVKGCAALEIGSGGREGAVSALKTDDCRSV